jgi:hypothetical protein
MQEIAFLRLVMQAGSTQSRMINKALFTMFCCIDRAAFTVSNRGAKKRVFTY